MLLINCGFLWRRAHHLCFYGECVEESFPLELAEVWFLDELCPVCGLEDEDIFHALISCPRLVSFWENAQLQFIHEFDCHIPFLEWFSCAVTQWDQSYICKFAVAIYKVWRGEI